MIPPASRSPTRSDAMRLGADGFAVAAFVRGATEAAHLRIVADCVRQAAAFEMPVICHVYPRDTETNAISFLPEDIAWAVRCAVEVGVDVVKTPYCGDVRAYAADRRRLSGAAGGRRRAEGGHAARRAGNGRPKSCRAARAAPRSAETSGAFEQIGAAVRAFKAVIHDGKSPDEALQQAGLAATTGGKR